MGYVLVVYACDSFIAGDEAHFHHHISLKFGFDELVDETDPGPNNKSIASIYNKHKSV